jgi:hypothetical protein
MAARFVVAELLATGKLHKVCPDILVEKRKASQQARDLASQFAPNPVVVVDESTYERHAQLEG